ncbi:MAG: methylamine utilization protein [Planctomycetes bacterium]|nr:methylamine utilization protein [Planctomycetota bacterium]
MKNLNRLGCLLVLALISAGPAAAGDPPAKKGETPKVSKTGTIKGRVKNRWVKRFPAVVYLTKIKGKTFKAPKKPVVIDQAGKIFSPRVVPILVGTTVRFHNSDPFEHNVLSPKPKFDLGKWSQGKHRDRVFKKTGPVTLLCNLHPEMIGYVVVCDTPYFAITNKKGKFKIKGVPPGTYTITTWHERLKPAKAQITVVADSTASVTLKPKKR